MRCARAHMTQTTWCGCFLCERAEAGAGDHSQSGSSMLLLLLLQEIVTVLTGNMYSLAWAQQRQSHKNRLNQSSMQRSISLTHAYSTFLHFYYNFKLETNYKYHYIICPKPIFATWRPHEPFAIVAVSRYAAATNQKIQQMQVNCHAIKCTTRYLIFLQFVAFFFLIRYFSYNWWL